MCPGCESKLNAKDELVGQTRNCPKCGTPVLIAQPDAAAEPFPQELAGLDEPAPDQHVHGASETSLRSFDVPERLDRSNHYLVCDKSKLVATWENNGQGWMLNTNFGLVSATRNHEQLPTQGDFKLIELKLTVADAGFRLDNVTSYQLALRWALTKLDKGDDKILSAVTGPGFLNKEQKNAVRRVIKDQFMPEVWQDSNKVLEYLGNTDYHSPGTG